MPEHEHVITFQAPERDHLAILIGSAPKGKIQVKINEMKIQSFIILWFW